MKGKTRTRWRRWVAAGIAALVLLPFAVSRPPSLPSGMRTRFEKPLSSAGSVRLVLDRTSWDPLQQQRVIHQEHVDTALRMIRDARSFILVDFFLWNSWQGCDPERNRALAVPLAEELLRAREIHPHMTILAMADPINRAYGSMEEDFYRRLAASGIPVVFTELNLLPDSNPLVSAPARLYGGLLMNIPWVRNWMQAPRLKNLLACEGPRMSALQVARLLFFKANHRKVLLTDTPGGGARALVTSFNPADNSSAHSNLGILLDECPPGAILGELDGMEESAQRPENVLESHPGAFREAARRIRLLLSGNTDPERPSRGPRMEWLTEGTIRDCILDVLDTAKPGAEVRIALFYLSDRGVIRAIAGAARRGVDIRMILDPNRDAFGHRKNGIPNRPVAAELIAGTRSGGVPVHIRWADTHGEQFHIKAMSLVDTNLDRQVLLGGSANWTRRNLCNLNLETDVLVEGDRDILSAFNLFFDSAWENRDSTSSTVPYETFAEDGWTRWWKTALYRVQEYTGLCTF